MKKLIIPLLMVLMLPIAYALSFDIYIPNEIEQGINTLTSLTIIADNKFDGSVALDYSSNIESETTTINFNEDDFTGTSPYQFTYNWYIKGTEPGNYDITATLSNQTNTITNISKTGTITDSTPTIISKSPTGTLKHTTINLGVVTNENTVCKGSVDNDKSYDDMDFIFIGTQTEHNYSLQLTEDSYNVYVKCKDIYDNIMPDSEVINFDIALPISIDIFLGSHAHSDIITQEQVTINVTTSESAECKYDTENVSFDSMDNTMYGTGTSHSISLELSSGEYTYYVVCKNSVESDPQKIHFIVDLPPTAEISLSQDTPLKAGIIEVTLLSSEKLAEAPKLEYTFNDAPTSYKPISLSSSDSLWKGYMIIKEGDDNKVGTFYFRGKDSIGNYGNIITEGSIFTVDTSKPEAVTSLKATSDINGRIKLGWHHDSDDIDYYKIYRSAISGVNYVDFYEDEDNDTRFVDSATENKVTYYYKVAAVDKAGNLGLLSTEVYATAVNGTETKEETKEQLPKVLPPNLVIKVDDFIQKINNALIDLDNALSILENKESKLKELSNELKLNSEVSSAKTKLNNYKTELTSIKSSYMSESELDLKINQMDLELKKIKKTTPKDISLVEETVYLEATTREDIRQALEKSFENNAVTEKQLKDMIEKNEELKANIKIETSAKVVTITYLDQTTKIKTLIQRRISHENPEPLNEVNIIEVIPKSVIESTNEIEFITNNYEIIETDPIIKWGFYELNYQGTSIKYRLDKRIDLDGFKKTKSTPVIITTIESGADNEITGMTTSVFDKIGIGKTGSIFAWIGLIVISGLLTYYFLIVRTNKVDLLKRKITPKISHRDYTDEPEIESRARKYKLLNKMYDAMTNSIVESKEFLPKSYINKDFEFLNMLIKEVNSYIENDKLSRAKYLYPRISVLYKHLNPKQKEIIYPKCVELHRKIDGFG